MVASGEKASLLMRNKAFTKRTTCIPMNGKDDMDQGKRAGLARKLQAARALAVRLLID